MCLEQENCASEKQAQAWGTEKTAQLKTSGAESKKSFSKEDTTPLGKYAGAKTGDTVVLNLSNTRVPVTRKTRGDGPAMTNTSQKLTTKAIANKSENRANRVTKMSKASLG